MDSTDYLNDSEYEIKASFAGISDILYMHYKVSLQSLKSSEKGSLPKQLKIKDKDIARIASYVLINSEQGDSEQIDIDALCDELDRYQALKVGKDHVVVFSELKKHFILDSIWFLLKYGLLTKWNPDDLKSSFKNYGPMVMDVIHYLQKAVKKLDETEECVFARIYELHRSGKRIFSPSDIQCYSIIKTHNGNASDMHVCDYQTENCFFRNGDNKELCDIDDSKIKSVMKSLFDKGILEPLREGSNDKWILVP